MLITRLLADSVQVVDKVKRKVRLASGLDKQNNLDQASISRGLECLSFFAERLQDIPTQNIRIVATATLRLAKNADIFLAKAEQILSTKVVLLSGIEEAELIYLGVAHTSDSANKRLVFDIGGASTEIVVGELFESKYACSLNMGCVTFNRAYFQQGELSEANFQAATDKAKQLIAPVQKTFQEISWQTVLSGSGTMQALAEILHANKQPAIINYDFLLQVKTQLIQCKKTANIKIYGLMQERKPVIASGVAILIALFECFNVTQVQLSSGAIREGLLYEMLPKMREKNIRTRTINSLVQRFHIDQTHAQRVFQQAEMLFKQLQCTQSALSENGFSILRASCYLHEVGLLLEYKYHQQHGMYILQHADLPGFEQNERMLLALFTRFYKGDLEPKALEQQTVLAPHEATLLLFILRVAVILCRRRSDDVLPTFKLDASTNNLILSLPALWLAAHPLIADELIQEIQHLAMLDLSLQIITE
jgi:exopolyphosphatase/guanosine-5'-triphosphate,3'-diphosphate pyrophosphatase